MRELPPIDVSIVQPNPRLGTELLRLIKWMEIVSWASLALGLVNIAAYVLKLNPQESVLVTGLVSVSMYGLVRMKLSYINGSKSWIEVSVTTACGLYLPAFSFGVSLLTLLGVLG
ncbi:MAG: hypothetical protein K2Q01_12285 [Rickettsiales bacterium]|nr:hypothetical protein [Rickettsiales bacterium]